jgi:2-methylcitrate dehydratase PrpD
MQSLTHPGAVVVPAVLAIAEAKHLSGPEILDAIVTGAEVMIRIGIAASPGLNIRGHHAPPAVGPFGAAAACARALHFEDAVVRNALAIAGSHAAGLLEFDRTGGSVKRIHCAIPAQAGVRSAFLAAEGITGPPTILEGRRGFLEVFSGSFDAEALALSLGDRFEALDIAFKPSACNFSVHAPVQALAALHAEHGFSAEDIDRVVVGTSEQAIAHVGTIVEPDDILGAQFSIAFSLAVRLLRGGNGFHDYREQDLHDPRYLELARKVTLVKDEIAEEERRRLGNRGAVVAVSLKDGRSFEHRVQYAKGLPQNPLSDAELSEKFFDAVEPRLGKAKAARLAEAIFNLDRTEDAGSIVSLTVGAPAA